MRYWREMLLVAFMIGGWILLIEGHGMWQMIGLFMIFADLFIEVEDDEDDNADPYARINEHGQCERCWHTDGCTGSCAPVSLEKR